ncbi:hypothetical protein N9V95_00480 [bacterium]|nr:hypothetical protein [bacterium]
MVNYLVTPLEVGQRPRFRLVNINKPGFALASGEFLVDENPAGKILSTDRVSLETATFDVNSAIAAARAQIVAFANQITATITNGYPEAERAAWPMKELEALAFLAAPTDPTLAPILATICALDFDAAGNDDPTDAEILAAITAKAEIVRDKAAGYRMIVSAVEALRTQGEAMLADCETQDEIDAVLAALRTKGIAQAATFGILLSE